MHICMYVCTCMWHQKRCALYMSWPKRKINFEKIHTKKMRNRFEPKHKKKNKEETRKIRNTLGPPMCVYIQERKRNIAVPVVKVSTAHTYICTHTHLQCRVRINCVHKYPKSEYRLSIIKGCTLYFNSIQYGAMLKTVDSSFLLY